MLESIPADQTFNQGAGLRDLPLDGTRTYYSFDLSSATDRFPVELQRELLSYSLGEEKATAWYDIMVGYPFKYRTPKGVTTEVLYSVGNPMGFYTS